MQKIKIECKSQKLKTNNKHCSRKIQMVFSKGKSNWGKNNLIFSSKYVHIPLEIQWLMIKIVYLRRNALQNMEAKIPRKKAKKVEYLWKCVFYLRNDLHGILLIFEQKNNCFDFSVVTYNDSAEKFHLDKITMNSTDLMWLWYSLKPNENKFSRRAHKKRQFSIAINLYCFAFGWFHSQHIIVDRFSVYLLTFDGGVRSEQNK